MSQHAAAAAAHAPRVKPSSGWRRFLTPERRRWLGPLIGVVFLGLVGWLVADHVKEIDWGEVQQSVAAYPATTLGAAALLVVLSHFTYSCYDLLGRRYAGHKLPTTTVLGVGLVSYAFNLNLGSLVGGVGFRLRLYTKLGLDNAQIARVIALSLVTNWSGWLLLAGATFAARQVQLPESFPISATTLQAIGFMMVALPLAYVALCFFSKMREWQWRDHRFLLPGGRLALAQLGLSSLNWALMGTIVWLLLPKELSYGTVLATLLSAAVIAVPTHVPGGLGILEAVFVGALGGLVAQHRLIAALLAYRAMYYLAPLVAAAAMHFTLEAFARRRKKRGQNAN